MSNPKDLQSLDQPMYQARKAVYPKKVDGFFRRLKWLIMAITLTIYYVTPWLRWDRGPYAPHQAVLVDMANRRFYMFAIEIWPHEFYFVAGLLIMAGIGLFLVTSAVGRAWCGYACPQTVWTDLFLHIERAIDGDRNAQIKLAAAPLGVSKIVKRVTKHAIWLVVAVATGGAWIFYFADAPTLACEFLSGSAPFVAYATVGVLTATTYTFGGFMREQICIYMCPWPRIQTAMLDEKSLVVTYKFWRGEPRTQGRKRAQDAMIIDSMPTGDCIDCTQCIQVCPTGIDIREGAQLGCITCGLCIDACDKVMDQIGKPRGLIHYATSDDCELEQAGAPPRPVTKALFHPRTLAYFAIWCAIGLGLLFALGQRTRLDLSAIQDRNPVYVQLSDGSVRNNYTVKVRNMEGRPRKVEIKIDGLPGAVLWGELGDRASAGKSVQIDVAADSVRKTRLFVAAPATGEAAQPFDFTVRALDSEGGIDRDDVKFERPAR